MMAIATAAMTVCLLTATQDASGIYRDTKAGIVTVKTDVATGTGFIFGDGSYAFTCWHVVSDARVISVEGVQATRAKVDYHDENLDVAILKLGKKFRHPLTIRATTPDPGARIYVIGSALGILDKTITEGLVSGIRHVGDASLLQISASITHGNSGSPVIDAGGEVVGMAQTSLTGTGINFALSAYDLKNSLFAARNSWLAQRDSNLDANTTDVAGYLAQAKKPTEVHALPSWKSKVYSSVSFNQYLVVRQSLTGHWTRVLLQNGDLGYVPTDSIKRLPYVFRYKALSEEQRIELTMEMGKLLDTPYEEGGMDPQIGLGSSQFVYKAYANAGLSIPSDLEAQSTFGMPVYRLEQLLPGDRLYFWDDKKSQIGQAGLYTGSGNFMISDPEEGKVCVHALDDRWRKILVAARRSGEDSQSLNKIGN